MIQETRERSRTSAWNERVGALGAFFLGAVLVVGGLSKAVDPQAFAEQIGAEGLDGVFTAPTLAVAGLGLEMGLGAALLLSIRRLGILIPATILVTLFLFLTGRSYWHYARGIVDETASCGCFGNLLDRTPAEAFWQDLLLMVPALGMSFLGRSEGRFPWLRIAPVAAATLGGLLLAMKAPELPLDDWATRLKPGKVCGDICAGDDESRVCLTSLIPDLQAGDHLVVLADLSSSAFGEAVKDLNRYFLNGQGPRLWVLSSSSPEEQRLFFWRRAPTFQVVEAPRTLLRPLYRSLPRSFLVSDGKVTETFSGLPPTENLMGEKSLPVERKPQTGES